MSIKTVSFNLGSEYSALSVVHNKTTISLFEFCNLHKKEGDCDRLPMFHGEFTKSLLDGISNDSSEKEYFDFYDVKCCVGKLEFLGNYSEELAKKNKALFKVQLVYLNDEKKETEIRSFYLL